MNKRSEREEKLKERERKKQEKSGCKEKQLFVFVVDDG